jgi:hypothetical protein
MDQPARQAASKPNPALEPFRVLIGRWEASGTHGLLPDTILRGHTSFEWLENGAFVLMRSELDDPRFPRTVAIIASDDGQAECYMLHYDERGVSRKYDVSLHDNVWKWWRNAPGFFQRYEGIISDDGNTIVCQGELSRDGSSWEKDLDVTYTRAA